MWEEHAWDHCAESAPRTTSGTPRQLPANHVGFPDVENIAVRHHESIAQGREAPGEWSDRSRRMRFGHSKHFGKDHRAMNSRNMPENDAARSMDPPRSTAVPLQFAINLNPGEVPVGRIEGRGLDVQFSGWMELLAAFEVALTTANRGALAPDPGSRAPSTL